MRTYISLLLSVLALGILGMAQAVRADNENDSFQLERTVIRGFVESVDDQVATIQTYSGDEYAVLLGSETYWKTNHYVLPKGAYVKMDVWYDPTDRYTDWYFAGEIWGPDFHFVLTNDEGVPYWVLFGEDYYYDLGYRASCVSYMYWYDCPPVYFVYLILPPPPPWSYTCYYGPHWRDHHHDWQHSPRYGRGGSYWQDGQGEQRPGRRSHEQPATDPGDQGSGSMADVYQPVMAANPPQVTPQPEPVRKVVVPAKSSVVVPPARKAPAAKEVIPLKRYQPEKPVYVSPPVNTAIQPKSETRSVRFEVRSTAPVKIETVKAAVRATSKVQPTPQKREQNDKKSNATDKDQEQKQPKKR
jgi:hypothetical protein